MAFDLVVIGGGIVGVSTAWQLKQRHPGLRILLLEKEDALGRHQTGRNSGVVHAGVYYTPGSLKAEFCKRGVTLTRAFCREQGLPYLQCGKLLVATDKVELDRMAALEARCARNGIHTRRLTADGLKQAEPRIAGLGALLVADTAITDYPRITAAMARLFTSAGGQVRLGRPVTSLEERSHDVVLGVGADKIHTRYLIVCGGLMADRLARMMGLALDFRIVPFRGEYYRLPARHNRIVKHLIYPIPDPALPFLGVHLTRMIDGSVTVGPNAVLGWKREGYGRINLDPRDIMEMLGFKGFWKAMGRHAGAGLMEFRDAFHKHGYLRRVRRYCPSLTMDDLRPHPAGIRAQAVNRDGTLVHDFLFAESGRSLHVCNAPSPAATSAIPIGEYLCWKAERRFDLG